MGFDSTTVHANSFGSVQPLFEINSIDGCFIPGTLFFLFLWDTIKKKKKRTYNSYNLMLDQLYKLA